MKLLEKLSAVNIKMTKGRIKIFLVLFVLFFSLAGFVFAEEGSNQEEILIYFFTDPLCRDCKNAEEFIIEQKNDYPQLELIVYPITDTKKLNEIAAKYEIEDYQVGMAPTIFINGTLLQIGSFTSNSEKEIMGAIQGELVDVDCCIQKIPFTNIEIDMANWSLPIITIALGSIDGFNICSIGALILVLSIVFVFDSKKKIFFYGGLFIFTAVLIYGLLVFIWGRLFEVLVGQLEILRIIIGLTALGGGIYFFKEFYRFFKYGPTCKASGSKIARKATFKLKQAFEEPDQKPYLLISSIIFFAIIITLVELPCSIGIPLAFAGILVEAGVSSTSYILYILLYLSFYMLIELIIFTGAVLTKKIWIADSKMITWVTFSGAIILFYLAFYYLIGT